MGCVRMKGGGVTVRKKFRGECQHTKEKRNRKGGGKWRYGSFVNAEKRSGHFTLCKLAAPESEKAFFMTTRCRYLLKFFSPKLFSTGRRCGNIWWGRNNLEFSSEAARLTFTFYCSPGFSVAFSFTLFKTKSGINFAFYAAEFVIFALIAYILWMRICIIRREGMNCKVS